MQQFLQKNISYFVSCGEENHPFARSEVSKRLGEKKYALSLLEKGVTSPEQLIKFRPMLSFQKKKVVYCIIKFLVKNGRWEEASKFAENNEAWEEMHNNAQYWSWKYFGKGGEGWSHPSTAEAGALWHVPLKEFEVDGENIRVFLKRGGEIPKEKWRYLWDNCPYLEKHLVKKGLIEGPPEGCTARDYRAAKKYGNAVYALYIEKEYKSVQREETTKEEDFSDFLDYAKLSNGGRRVRGGLATWRRSCLKYSPQAVDIFNKFLEEGGEMSDSTLHTCLRSGKFMFSLMNSEGAELFRRAFAAKKKEFGSVLFSDDPLAVESMIFYGLENKNQALWQLSAMSIQDFIDRGLLTREDMENFWAF
nr:hypothetical protein MarFTME_396 [Marseillevirus futianmevirus]